jgi:hypothetical protein
MEPAARPGCKGYGRRKAGKSPLAAHILGRVAPQPALFCKFYDRPQSVAAADVFFARHRHLDIIMSRLGLIVASLAASAAMGIAFTAWRSQAVLVTGGADSVAWALVGLAALAGGGGLMALVFWSNRKGFDDRAGARPDSPRRNIPHQE